MSPQPNEPFALYAALPRLRSDLVISEQKIQGRTSYVVKDPVSLRYYRLGTQEMTVARLLDGERTLAEVITETRRAFLEMAIDELRIIQILEYLMRMSFLELPADLAQPFFSSLIEQRRALTRQSRLMRIGGLLLSFQIPLFDPDLLLLRMEKHLRFIWTKTAVVILVLVLALSLGLVLANGDQVETRLSDFLTLNNLFLVWVSLIFVKIVHEFGHGLTCKHFGGEVHDMGAFFMVLTPFLYCDATDSWMFVNKWDRIKVNLGGMFFELYLASLAAAVWAFSQPGLLHELAFNVVVVCSVTTVIFNINPLMKFDGYYALADWMEVPNLRSKAGQYLSGLATSFVTGNPPPVSEGETRTRQRMFAFYGVASYIYTLFIFTRLTKVIGYKLEPYGLGGLGTGITVLTMAAGFIFPIVQFSKYLRQHSQTNTGDSVVKRRLIQMAAGLAVVLLLLLFLPWKREVMSHCVLDGGNRVEVRASANAFVRNVLVKEGDLVAKDQVVAVLENPDLQDDLKDLESRLQILNLWRQRAQALGDASALKQFDADTKELLASRDKLQKEIDTLQLKSPATGVVMSADLDLLKGLYLREGDLVCEVIPPERMRIVLPLSEDEASLVSTGQTVDLCLDAFPWRVFHGTVTKTFVAGSMHLPHAALAARFGGDIPTELDRTNTERPITPVYQAELQIENTGHLLRPGMSGRARILCGQSTPARIIAWHLRNLLRLDFLV